MSKEYIISLENVDFLESRWWNMLRGVNFGYLEYIPYKLSEVKCIDGDVFIHKEIMENERFPTVLYHLVMDGELLTLPKKDITDELKNYLVDFIVENLKLPYACHLGKLYKNGSYRIKYEPTKFDSFSFKFEPEEIGFIDEDGNTIEDYYALEMYDTVKTNPLEENDNDNDIEPIFSNRAMKIASESRDGKVYVSNAKIVYMSLRKSIFNNYETRYYIVRIQNFNMKILNPLFNPITEHYVDEANIRLSENIVEKYDLNIGDIISFKGKVIFSPNEGYIIKYIKKIEVEN